MSTALVNKPSLIEYPCKVGGKDKTLRFLIMDAPKPENLHLYLKEWKKNNVKAIARISEPCYDIAEVNAAGIVLHEMHFEDGASPPAKIISDWNALVTSIFDKSTVDAEAGGATIAVHCVAGLGRAPVLVAIALIEHGMDAISAVTLIRSKRRGAINATQLAYLETYKPQKTDAPKGCGCTIM